MVSQQVSVKPFRVPFDEAAGAGLRQRLGATRWSPADLEEAGTASLSTGLLKQVVALWSGFDWAARVAQLNRWDHALVGIGGAKVHVLRGKGRGPRPLPLLLTHGWPSSFCEYLTLVPLLVDPAAHGGEAADAFDVIVPSLPGFGFSPLTGPTWPTSTEVADLWARLMVEGLGYSRFGAHGSDVGAGVTARLAQRHPANVVGAHLSAISLPVPVPPLTEAERAYERAVASWSASQGAYAHAQATRPGTLAAGLNDSPVALAAWLVDAFRCWSDCRGDVLGRLSPEWVLTTLTLYWATGTIGSSLWPYHSARRHHAPLAPESRVSVPTGFALFPNEDVPMPSPPRQLAERYFAVERWSEFPVGGHFPAVEEPAILATELREFFRPLR